MNNIKLMLETVSKKLGTTPQKLEQALKTGDINRLIADMPPKDAEKLKSVLGDAEAVKKARELSKNAQ